MSAATRWRYVCAKGHEVDAPVEQTGNCPIVWCDTPLRQTSGPRKPKAVDGVTVQAQELPL